MKISRRKHIPLIILGIGFLCYIIGKIKSIPFDLNWLYSMLPLLGFSLSETEKRKQIKIEKVFVEQKFKEPRFIVSIAIPLLLIVNWILQVFFNDSLQYDTTEISALSSIAAVFVSSFRGKDKSTKEQK